MLVLSRGPEEAIMIGADVEVRILEVRGDRVRLGIEAPASVAIHRKEVFLSIQRENLAAAASVAAGLEGAVAILANGSVPAGGAARSKAPPPAGPAKGGAAGGSRAGKKSEGRAAGEHELPPRSPRRREDTVVEPRREAAAG